MTPEDVLDLFKQTGGLLEGHFLYASGRHGRHFLQASRVLQYPRETERLCRELAKRFSADEPELVVGPATGGIILAYETARHLDARAAYTEKSEDGGMALKRGFPLSQGTRCLVVEDIITTGGSARKTAEHLEARGAEVIGIGALVDRSGGEAHFPVRFEALAQLTLESWPPEECPLEQAGIPLTDPDDLTG